VTEPDASTTLDRSAGLLLVAAVFVIAVCGLIYELIAGTISSYLLGNSVTQFSLVIGLFLTAMGLGSFLSKFVRRDLLTALIAVEISVGAVGGIMGLAGFATFATTALYLPVLFGFVGTVGVLVGLEIPLVVRILQELSSLRVNLANVLSADYAGALLASLLFPFALLPHMGVVRAGLVMGLMNVLVAGVVLWRFRSAVSRPRRLAAACGASAVVLGGALAASPVLVSWLETRLYADDIIYARDTSYQRLVVTRWRDDVRLFLDGHLQFSSIDEYRYHETLVLPAMGLAEARRRVLILGGGDGLAARQVLKFADVEAIDLVDIDPAVTGLFRDTPMLAALNGDAMSDSRLTVHNEDAMRFVRDGVEPYDVIIIDLPDPSAPGLGRLFSQAFFSLVGRRLTPGGMIGIQCTSPFRSREAFWCIVHTLEAARWGPEETHRLKVVPYHTLVPTFGTWGFAVAGTRSPKLPNLPLDVPTRYLTREILPGLTTFPADMAEVDTPVSHMDDPVVSRLYRRGYHKYLE
jgi:spermidine synthase